MPSLNLRNPLRRDPNCPTLKQRAAALKASAAGLIRKPKPLSAAGSPEAVEAFGAACRTVDAASRLSDGEMEALHIMPGGASLWTSDTATAALAGNFSRFAPREIEAARATSKARLEELQILTLRRELRMAEAMQTSRMRELFTLAYGDQPDPTDEPDPHLAYQDRLITGIVERWAAKPLAGITPSEEQDGAQHLVNTGLDDLIEEVAALPPPRTPQGLGTLAIAIAAHFEGAIGPNGDYPDETMAATLIRAVLAFTDAPLPPVFVGFGDEPDFKARENAAFSGPYALPGWAMAAAREEA